MNLIAQVVLILKYIYCALSGKCILNFEKKVLKKKIENAFDKKRV